MHPPTIITIQPQLTMAMTTTKMSILMFPWLAHGHISPFLELAKKLTERNFTVYLCSTPIILDGIKDKISDSIKLVKLHLPSLPELPPHFHTTMGLPPHLMFTLKQALDMSLPNFCNILDTLNPDLVIYDLLQPWAAAAAAERDIPAVEFISSSGTMTSFQFHRVHHPNKVFPFPNIYYRDYEARAQSRQEDELKKDENYEKEKQRGILALRLSYDIVLIKSFVELEGKYNDYLSGVVGKKIIPVGPLIKDPNLEEEGSDIIKWLNGKAVGSTVYASFGSEFFLSKEDLEEIAYGLEKSNVSFIWVVRFPKGEKIRVCDELPLGFLERVGNRGLVVEGWAPQIRILNHPSIGGFVSHCGWNSVMESIKFGIPIIAMPMHLDQPVNARLVEEVGVGIEVVRDSDGRLHREEVTAVIRRVVVEKDGEVVRKNAKKFSKNINKKGDEEIDAVVKELTCLVQKKQQVQ